MQENNILYKHEDLHLWKWVISDYKEKKATTGVNAY